MKINQAVEEIRAKFGKDVSVQITAEFWTFPAGEVSAIIKVWVSKKSDPNTRCETDTTLARAVNKILNDVEPTAVQHIIEQVEEMAK